MASVVMLSWNSTDNKRSEVDQQERMALDPENEKTKPKSFWRKLCSYQVIFNLIFGPTIVVGIFIVGTGIVRSKKIGFMCQDPSLSFRFQGDTVSDTELLLGSLSLPLLLIIVIELIRRGSYSNIRGSIIWLLFKDIAIQTWFMTLIMEIAKFIFVEHRPHFLDTCRPDKNFNCTPGTYIEDYTCTNEASSRYSIAMASRSFPSSHASTSTFCAVFCVYLIQTRMPSALTGSILKLSLKSLCVGWCVYCSMTRISDRRHHWWDVLCGAVIGFVCAIYFVAIFHRNVRSQLNKAQVSTIP